MSLGPKPSFMPHIEGLRGVAIILVMLNHLGFGLFSAGFIGVDIFFVISGYLITGLLVREYLSSPSPNPSPRINLKHFYFRRARRILPAALVAAVLTLVAATLIFNPFRLRAVVADFWWAILQSSNIGFTLSGVDYFGRDWQTSPFQHYWSLAIEEQFYLIWPLLLLIILAALAIRPKRNPTNPNPTNPSPTLNGLSVALALITAGSFASMQLLFASAPDLAYLSLISRAWELSLGGLVAVLLMRQSSNPNPHTPNPTTQTILAWLGVAGLTTSMFWVTPENFGYTIWLPVISSAILVGFGHKLAHKPGHKLAHFTLLGNPALRFTGRISYSLYLYHWPVFYFTAVILLEPSRTSVIISLLVAFGLAIPSYFFIERPFQKIRPPQRILQPPANKRSPPKLVAVTTALFTLVALIPPATQIAEDQLQQAAQTLFPQPAPKSFAMMPTTVDPDANASYDQALSAHAEYLQATIAQMQTRSLTPTQFSLLDESTSLATTWGETQQQPGWRCEPMKRINQRNCRFGPEAASETWLIIGDSFADMWTPALRRIAQHNPDLQVATLTMGQCNNNNLLDQLNTRTPQVAKDCLEFHQTLLESVAKLGSDTERLRIIFSDAFAGPPNGAYAKSSAEFIRGVSAASGKTPGEIELYVFSTKPRSESLLSCLNASMTNAPECEMKSRAENKRIELKRSIAEVTGANFINIDPWFCINDTCPAFIGDTPTTLDGSHVSPYTAQALSALFEAAVRQVDGGQ